MWKLLPDPQNQSLIILEYKYISKQENGVIFLAAGLLGNNSTIKGLMTCTKCRTCRHWWKHEKAKNPLTHCVSWASLFTWAKKIGISAIGYTGVKRKVIRIFFTYLTERICNNSPVDNGWKLYLFKVLCSTCLTQCSLRIPDVYCFVLSSFSKTIFPAIHGCNAAKCLTYPRFENGGKNSVFTVILQLSKWQVIEVSEESRSHRVSTTPWRAHWRYKVDIHQFTEGS